jgi:hypothetical protein
MKQTFAVSLLLLALACNTPADKATQTDSSARKTDTALAIVATSAPATDPNDPDPTDSIPADRYEANSVSRETADRVRATLREQMKGDLEKGLIDSFSRKFIFFEYDLNDDGRKEIFVGLNGSYFCGSGGCTQYLLDDRGRIISIFSVSGYPVVIDTKKTNGWKDLFIHSGGKDRIVKFNGQKYPSNPSTLPALKVVPGDGLPRALNYINEPYPWFRF